MSPDVDPAAVETMRAQGSALQSYGLVIVAALLSSVGNLIIKNATKAMGGLNLTGSQVAQSLFHLFTNPGVVVGLILYLVGFVLWAKVLTTVDISTAYPIFISLAFVIVVIGSGIFLRESVSALKLIGIVVIAAGIIIVSRG